MMVTLTRLYRMLAVAGDALQSPFLLAVRLYWGWQFAQTGWGKLGNLTKVTNFFTQLGIPAPGLNAGFISTLEFVGGILLAAGLASRLISLLLAGDMVVAFWVADRQALFSVFSDPDKLYQASAYTFLFAALIVLIFGPGKLSLDAIIAKRITNSQGNSTGWRRTQPN